MNEWIESSTLTSQILSAFKGSPLEHLILTVSLFLLLPSILSPSHPACFSIPIEPQRKGASLCSNSSPEILLWGDPGARGGAPLTISVSHLCLALPLKFRIYLLLDLYSYLACDPKWVEVGSFKMSCSLAERDAAFRALEKKVNYLNITRGFFCWMDAQ